MVNDTFFLRKRYLRESVTVESAYKKHFLQCTPRNTDSNTNKNKLQYTAKLTERNRNLPRTTNAKRTKLEMGTGQREEQNSKWRVNTCKGPQEGQELGGWDPRRDQAPQKTMPSEQGEQAKCHQGPRETFKNLISVRNSDLWGGWEWNLLMK